jgi:hypothetical protein
LAKNSSFDFAKPWPVFRAKTKCTVCTAGKKLVENGFLLDQVQKDFDYLNTKPKDLSKMNLTLKLKVKIEEKREILTGDFNLRGINSIFEVIQNRGMKGSPMRR